MNVRNDVTKGTNGFVGGGVKDLAGARNPSEGGLHGDESTAVGWIVHRTASICAKRTQTCVGLDRGGRASGRATREVVRVDWISHNSIQAVLSERSHAKLVHVCGANHNSASFSQLVDSCGVDRRGKVYKKLTICKI